MMIKSRRKVNVLLITLATVVLAVYALSVLRRQRYSVLWHPDTDASDAFQWAQTRAASEYLHDLDPAEINNFYLNDGETDNDVCVVILSTPRVDYLHVLTRSLASTLRAMRFAQSHGVSKQRLVIAVPASDMDGHAELQMLSSEYGEDWFDRFVHTVDRSTIVSGPFGFLAWFAPSFGSTLCPPQADDSGRDFEHRSHSRWKLNQRLDAALALRQCTSSAKYVLKLEDDTFVAQTAIVSAVEAATKATRPIDDTESDKTVTLYSRADDSSTRIPIKYTAPDFACLKLFYTEYWDGFDKSWATVRTLTLLWLAVFTSSLLLVFLVVQYAGSADTDKHTHSYASVQGHGGELLPGNAERDELDDLEDADTDIEMDALLSNDDTAVQKEDAGHAGKTRQLLLSWRHVLLCALLGSGVTAFCYLCNKFNLPFGKTRGVTEAPYPQMAQANFFPSAHATAFAQQLIDDSLLYLEGDSNAEFLREFAVDVALGAYANRNDV
ncbi:MAG: hypothetical protein MHM6MM_003191, partial [Cercozoa sp. M6MM]